jgi:hypothetical protein
VQAFCFSFLGGGFFRPATQRILTETNLVVELMTGHRFKLATRRSQGEDKDPDPSHVGAQGREFAIAQGYENEYGKKGKKKKKKKFPVYIGPFKDIAVRIWHCMPFSTSTDNRGGTNFKICEPRIKAAVLVV